MKILNLVDLDKSDIKYKINNYPDGQRDITILSSKSEIIADYIEIKSRMNNMEDLGMIECTSRAIKKFEPKGIHLYCPYILGARSDRAFTENGLSYLKDIIAPRLNAQNFKSITCLDIHNPTMADACINDLVILSNEDLVKEAFCQIGDFDSRNIDNHCVILSPDAGASKKIYKLAQQIDYNGDIITCSKDRDIDGKLTKTVVPKLKNDKKDYIVIDDIGDRFGTFKNIAKEIKKDNNFTGKLYLIVTHSIQDEGIIEALKYYDQIFTTNSFKDRVIENCKVLNIF